MKIIENKYEDLLFPKKVECSHCKSILEVERADCNHVYNKYTLWNEYYYVCPCCKNENRIDSPL